MVSASVVDSLRRRFLALKGELDERARRRWAASEARELGHGGIAAVSRATGLSYPTIKKGIRELDDPTSTAEP